MGVSDGSTDGSVDGDTDGSTVGVTSGVTVGVTVGSVVDAAVSFAAGWFSLPASAPLTSAGSAYAKPAHMHRSNRMLIILFMSIPSF